MKLGGQGFVNKPDLVLTLALDVKAAVTFWNWKSIGRKVDLLDSHIVVPSSHGTVEDQRFQAAVHPINAKYININKRAASYNRYINLFQP